MNKFRKKETTISTSSKQSVNILFSESNFEMRVKVCNIKFMSSCFYQFQYQKQSLPYFRTANSPPKHFKFRVKLQAAKTLYRVYLHCIANVCATLLNIFSKEIISENTKCRKQILKFIKTKTLENTGVMKLMMAFYLSFLNFSEL